MELNTFLQIFGLDTRQIIDGMCLDPYRLTLQQPFFWILMILSSKILVTTEQVLRHADVTSLVPMFDSNTHVKILYRFNVSANPTRVGIYRLVMKSNTVISVHRHCRKRAGAHTWLKTANGGV
ncbi:hypothetical protein OH492_21855 [Vibrio chagasii]|nr:hypothetical protein [Vibrio chagasii]